MVSHLEVSFLLPRWFSQFQKSVPSLSSWSFLSCSRVVPFRWWVGPSHLEGCSFLLGMSFLPHWFSRAFHIRGSLLPQLKVASSSSISRFLISDRSFLVYSVMKSSFYHFRHWTFPYSKKVKARCKELSVCSLVVAVWLNLPYTILFKTMYRIKKAETSGMNTQNREWAM